MAYILVADDEPAIRAVIKEYAEFLGHTVDEARDGAEAIEMAKLNDYDVAVLDIMMPRMDGYSACKEIRRLKGTPVIMLSARGEEYDKLFGFEIGIDDYVVKPFSPKELMARINVVVERNKGRAVAGDVYEYQGLRIDFSGRRVTIDGKEARLTPKEYDLLFFLVRNRNIAFSRQQLLLDVWGYDYYGDERTVDSHIKMLRSNLGGYRRCIVTLRGMGYKFEDRQA